MSGGGGLLSVALGHTLGWAGHGVRGVVGVQHGGVGLELNDQLADSGVDVIAHRPDLVQGQMASTAVSISPLAGFTPADRVAIRPAECWAKREAAI